MVIEDVGRAVDFYRDVLGFEVVWMVHEDGAPAWALVQREDIELLFQRRGDLALLLPASPAPDG